MTAPFAVIGIGNTLRGDDGVGARVIEGLRDRVDSGRVGLFTCHQLLPEDTVALCRRRGVVFVDADVTLAPGEVRLTEIEVAPSVWRWGHQLRPGVLLGLVDAHERPRAFAVGIGAAGFEYGETLSDVVAGAVDGAIREVLAWIDRVDRDDAQPAVAM